RLLREMIERREAAMRAIQVLGRSWERAHDADRQLRETQAALATAQIRYDEFYEFVPTPFVVLDDRLRVVELNRRAAVLFGPAYFLRLPFVALVAPPDVGRVLAALSGLAPDASTTVEIALRSARGFIPVQLVVKARRRHRSDSKGLYVAVFDLSELRRLEDERRRSAEGEQAALAAARAKDEFIAMLSHELRTPLAPLLNAAEALGAADLEAGLHDAAAAIKRNVLVEARLIDDLLDAARVTQKLLSVERHPLSLHELIRSE